MARDAADRVPVRALGEHEPHRARPFELQRQPALELERARHQRGRGHRLAERGRDGFGILVVLDRRAPARVEPHQVAANREALEQEAMQQVARGRHGPASIFFSSSFSCAGIRLARGRLHDLADEEAEQLVLARAVVRELAAGSRR